VRRPFAEGHATGCWKRRVWYAACGTLARVPAYRNCAARGAPKAPAWLGILVEGRSKERDMADKYLSCEDWPDESYLNALTGRKPEWAPEGAWALYATYAAINCMRLVQDTGKPPSPEELDPDIKMIGRLVTRLDMQDVWKPLQRRMRFWHWDQHFVDAVERAFRGPLGWERRAPKERRMLYGSIAQHAKELAALLHESKFWIEWFDMLGVDPLGLDLLRGEQIAAIKTRHPDFDPKQLPSIPNFEALLLQMARLAERRAGQPPILKRPNDGSASLHYFVRLLTRYLVQVYGEPLRGVVAVTTTVALELERELSAAEVSRLAPMRLITLQC
jgi:hypothetical protein